MRLLDLFRRKKKKPEMIKGLDLLERIKSRPLDNSRYTPPAVSESSSRDPYVSNSAVSDSFYDISNNILSFFDDSSSSGGDSGPIDSGFDFGGGSGDGGGSSGEW